MRVLGSSVLIGEAIVVLLAALVAGGTGAIDSMGTALAIGGVLALALILGAGALRSPRIGITIGWILQLFVLAGGFWVPAMWIVGGIFVALWYLAVRNGTRVDALRAQREINGSDGDSPGSEPPQRDADDH
jgi:hypothetical protein